MSTEQKTMTPATSQDTLSEERNEAIATKLMREVITPNLKPMGSADIIWIGERIVEALNIAAAHSLQKEAARFSLEQQVERLVKERDELRLDRDDFANQLRSLTALGEGK